MKTISILGSTGSIGTQALDVVRQNPDGYRVVAIGANSSVQILAQQVMEFKPEVVAISDETKVQHLNELLQGEAKNVTEIHSGQKALEEVSTTADVVVNGVVGFAGLPVTVTALKAGKRLALANKESLIAAGPMVEKVRSTPGAELIPVDSEHCAIHQCLRANEMETQSVDRIVLTASGGPFRGYSPKELEGVSLKEALSHPTWDMGPKITVDSSTLMNKGLEVIEANALFKVPYDQIEVVVHPQSVVHSMVEFTDAATIAQLSLPDMRLCIGYALAFPERLATPFGRIDWQDLNRLDFEPPDLEAFPALGLAYEAGRRGNTAPAVLNAANEVANAAFCEEQIPWNAIPKVVEATLECHGDIPADELPAIIQEDQLARKTAQKVVEGVSYDHK